MEAMTMQQKRKEFARMYRRGLSAKGYCTNPQNQRSNGQPMGARTISRSALCGKTQPNKGTAQVHGDAEIRR